MRSLLAAMLVLNALPAYAASGPWTPAPTPNVGVNDHVTPTARAGKSTGSAQDAPFSGIPTGSVTAGGATSSNTVNGAQTPDLSVK